jgi:hypothetical protein
MSDILTRIGVGGIIVGNTLAATALEDAYGSEVKRPAVIAGLSLASLGWIITGIGESITGRISVTRVGLVWISLLGVAASSIAAMWLRANNSKVPTFLVGITVVSWILVGTAVAINNRFGRPNVSLEGMAAGLVSALLQSASFALLAPWERNACITEGFSQVLSMLGWWLFINIR